MNKKKSVLGGHKACFETKPLHSIVQPILQIKKTEKCAVRYFINNVAMTLMNLQNGFKISRTQIILLLASSANAWKDRVQIQESDKEYKLSGSVGSSIGSLSGSQGGSYSAFWMKMHRTV